MIAAKGEERIAEPDETAQECEMARRKTLLRSSLTSMRQPDFDRNRFSGAECLKKLFYFRLSATATATATVAPTMGLLPIEIRSFIRQKPIVLFYFSSLFKSFSHLSVSFFIPTFFITLLLFFSGWRMVDNSQLLSQLLLFIVNHHHRLR